eukprot:6819907-Pyramimonas_sp.AAC.1
MPPPSEGKMKEQRETNRAGLEKRLGIVSLLREVAPAWSCFSNNACLSAIWAANSFPARPRVVGVADWA